MGHCRDVTRIAAHPGARARPCFASGDRAGPPGRWRDFHQLAVLPLRLGYVITDSSCSAPEPLTLILQAD